MKTLLMLFRPAIELLLAALPGLLLLALGATWWLRRRSRLQNRDSGSDFEPPGSAGR